MILNTCIETFKKCTDDQNYKAGGLIHSVELSLDCYKNKDIIIISDTTHTVWIMKKY